MCGALTIKNQFRKNSLLVFVNRDKKAVVKDIVERDIDPDDKVRRIMSLDFEYRNAEVCDIELKVGNDAKESAKLLAQMIETKYTHGR